MVGPELLGPQELAGLLVEALQAAGDAGGEQPVARRSAASSTGRCPFPGASLWNVIGRGVLPERLAGLGVRGEHDLLARLAVHRVEHAVLDRRRRVALAERPLPDHRRAAGRPGVLQAGGLGLEVAMRTAPLRPRDGRGRPLGWSGRLPACPNAGAARAMVRNVRRSIANILSCGRECGAPDATSILWEHPAFVDRAVWPVFESGMRAPRRSSATDSAAGRSSESTPRTLAARRPLTASDGCAGARIECGG